MSIITQTKEETQDVVDIPIAKLAEHCHDPRVLAAVISLAYNKGYQLGQEQAHRHYRAMFTGDTAISN